MEHPWSLKWKLMEIATEIIWHMSERSRALKMSWRRSWNSREQKGLSFKQAGGVCGADSQRSLPRNVRQAAHIKKKASQKDPSVHKDPLASILELQKSTFPGFIRGVTCNDLPTVTLFTDRQIDNLIKFCCHARPGWVSELGVDVTFQLGPFYLLVTTFRNTMLEAKRSLNAPAFPGPLMISTIVVKKAPKPSIPPPTAPLVLKEISGGIRKCAGCCKPLLTSIPGYDAEQDKTFCFGRFESYTYFNKADKCHKVATSTRHYHLNPVCAMGKLAAWRFSSCYHRWRIWLPFAMRSNTEREQGYMNTE